MFKCTDALFTSTMPSSSHNFFKIKKIAQNTKRQDDELTEEIIGQKLELILISLRQESSKIKKYYDENLQQIKLQIDEKNKQIQDLIQQNQLLKKQNQLFRLNKSYTCSNQLNILELHAQKKRSSTNFSTMSTTAKQTSSSFFTSSSFDSPCPNLFSQSQSKILSTIDPKSSLSKTDMITGQLKQTQLDQQHTSTFLLASFQQQNCSEHKENNNIEQSVCFQKDLNTFVAARSLDQESQKLKKSNFIDQKTTADKKLQNLLHPLPLNIVNKKVELPKAHLYYQIYPSLRSSQISSNIQHLKHPIKRQKLCKNQKQNAPKSSKS